MQLSSDISLAEYKTLVADVFNALPQTDSMECNDTPRGRGRSHNQLMRISDSSGTELTEVMTLLLHCELPNHSCVTARSKS